MGELLYRTVNYASLVPSGGNGMVFYKLDPKSTTRSPGKLVTRRTIECVVVNLVSVELDTARHNMAALF